MLQVNINAWAPSVERCARCGLVLGTANVFSCLSPERTSPDSRLPLTLVEKAQPLVGHLLHLSPSSSFSVPLAGNAARGEATRRRNLMILRRKSGQWFHRRALLPLFIHLAFFFLLFSRSDSAGDDERCDARGPAQGSPDVQERRGKGGPPRRVLTKDREWYSVLHPDCPLPDSERATTS